MTDFQSSEFYNIEFLEFIRKHNSEDFKSWEIVVFLYILIPIIDGLLKSNGISIDDHSTRNLHIKNNFLFSNIKTEYFRLFRNVNYIRYTPRSIHYLENLNSIYDSCAKDYNTIRKNLKSLK